MNNYIRSAIIVGLAAWPIACTQESPGPAQTTPAAPAAVASSAKQSAVLTKDNAERLAADLSVGKDVKTIDAAKLIDEGKRTDAALSTRMDADLKYAPRDLATLAAPWEMFAKELDKQIRGTADWQGVQIVAMPLDASWNDPKYGKYRAWRLLGDSLPAWGPSYRATQAQVSTGYKIFIDNLDIKPPDPALRRQAEDALDKYNDKLAKMQRLQEKVGEHWLAFDLHQRPLPPNRQLTFDQWYARYDGATIAGAQGEVDLAGQKYASVMNQAGGGYGFVANILNDYNNPAFQAPAESPSGGSVFARQYDISPDLQAFIDLAKAGGRRPLTIALDRNSGRQSLSQTAWSGGASYGLGFFSFGVNASGGSSTVDTSSQTFKMEFSAKNYDVFTILPAGWFNGTAVKALQNGPWLPGGPVADGVIKLWGPDGVLDLMVTQVIVAYQPKVVATVSASEYSEIKSHFSTSGGFSIGPFGFGGGYSRSNSDVHFDDASKSFTAEDKTDVPQILAVVCSVLPKMR